MIHDPEIEVTCDGTNCGNSVFLPMRWNVNGYNLEDLDAKRLLDTDHYWLTVEGNHYCEDCKLDQT